MKIDLFDTIKQNELPMELAICADDLVVSLPESVGRVECLSNVTLKLVMSDSGHLLLMTAGHAIVTTECARCLSDVRQEIDFQAEITLTVAKTEILDESDDPVGVVWNGVLDMDQWISEEILVNLPSKVLCQEDCKGICPKCGQNLNQSECGCDRFVMDPRMQKVLDVFSEAKEV